MTVHSFWQQSLAYSASEVRNLAGLWWRGGDGVRSERITGSSPLLVHAQTVPNMTVKVNAGWAKKGNYIGFNDAAVNVTIGTADASNPRIDLVVMRWRDTEAGDATSSATLEVIPGAPAAIPAAPSTVGMTVQVLAQVAVAAGTTSIAGAAITDARALINPAGLSTLQMVQTVATNIPHGVYTLLASMSRAIANGGFDDFVGETLTGGVLTMPPGSAGAYRLSGQVSIAVAAGVTGVAAAIQLNGANIISVESAVGAPSVQTVSFAARRFTLADGDTLNLAGFTFGADSTSFVASDTYRSFLLIEQVA